MKKVSKELLPLLVALIIVTMTAHGYLFACLPLGEDRSAFAQQTHLDPNTGQLIAVPTNYTNLGVANRSAFVATTTINGSTGQLTGVPSTYTNLGVANRSAFVAATAINGSTGQLTGVPSNYTNLSVQDRSVVALGTTINTTTGQLIAVASNFILQPLNEIPTLSAWGSAALCVLLLLIAGWILRRRAALQSK